MSNLVKPQFKLTAEQYLNKPFFKEQLKMALPKHIDPNRMKRSAITALRENPDLEKTNPLSFCGSVIKSAQLGLELGNEIAHAYLIPYGNKCQLSIGYRGMIALAWRSNKITSINSGIIYENEYNDPSRFEYEEGTNCKFIHKPLLRDRGEVCGFYSYITSVNGGFIARVMNLEDIENVKKHSKTAKAGPWSTHFNEMAKKTTVRALFKYTPISVELSQAITLDEAAERGAQDNSYLMRNLVSIEGEDYLTPSQDEVNDLLDNKAA